VCVDCLSVCLWVQRSLTLSLPISRPGDYVLVMQYYSQLSDSRQRLDVELQHSRQRGHLKLPTCPYRSVWPLTDLTWPKSFIVYIAIHHSRRRCDCLASSAPFTNIQTYLLTSATIKVLPSFVHWRTGKTERPKAKNGGEVHGEAAATSSHRLVGLGRAKWKEGPMDKSGGRALGYGAAPPSRPARRSGSAKCFPLFSALRMASSDTRIWTTSINIFRQSLKTYLFNCV